MMLGIYKFHLLRGFPLFSKLLRLIRSTANAIRFAFFREFVAVIIMSVPSSVIIFMFPTSVCYCWDLLGVGRCLVVSLGAHIMGISSIIINIFNIVGKPRVATNE